MPQVRHQLRLVTAPADDQIERVDRPSAASGPTPTTSSVAPAIELPPAHEHEPELRGVPRATLPFPTAAVHVLNRERIARLTTPVHNAKESLAHLEAGINKHLDRAQQLVNQLHQEVENYKFPALPNDDRAGRSADDGPRPPTTPPTPSTPTPPRAA
jgi:hypothetical protein